jgi:hypothetical protein
MFKFVAGIVVTLAVLYPVVTKELFGSAVDVTNSTVTNVMEKAK